MQAASYFRCVAKNCSSLAGRSARVVFLVVQVSVCRAFDPAPSFGSRAAMNASRAIHDMAASLPTTIKAERRRDEMDRAAGIERRDTRTAPDRATRRTVVS